MITSNLFCFHAFFIKSFRICILTSLCLSANWHLINFVWNVSLRVEEGTWREFLHFQKWRKKKAYPTNVVDLWVVACKPIILAGNQSCSQSYELVKCVTCQGSLRGFSSRGLGIKATSLERGPLLLWQRRSQPLKDFHLSPEPLLFSSFFFLRKWDESGTVDLGNQAFPVYVLEILYS